MKKSLNLSIYFCCFQLWKKSGPLVKELLQLADRELDLLARGLMSSALSGLQSRLRALLRHFITEQLPQPPVI